jgi:hypothetical protein
MALSESRWTGQRPLFEDPTASHMQPAAAVVATAGRLRLPRGIVGARQRAALWALDAAARASRGRQDTWKQRVSAIAGRLGLW